MAAVLIVRLPGAPLWGGRGVGGQKALPHAATPQHTRQRIQTTIFVPRLIKRWLLFTFIFSLALALLIEFQRLFSFLCLFELLMQKCSPDSLAAKTPRQRERKRKTQALPPHSSLDLKKTIWVNLTLSLSQWGRTRPIAQHGHGTCDRSGQQKLSDSSMPAGRLSLLRPTS